MSFAVYMQKLLTPLALIATLLLVGCSVYKLEIQQGNVVTQEMVDGLKPGMSKRQVAFLLGTPLVADAFHQDRWDYYYSLRPGGKETEQQRIAVFFEDEKLVRVEGDMRPMDKSDATITAENPGTAVTSPESAEKRETF